VTKFREVDIMFGIAFHIPSFLFSGHCAIFLPQNARTDLDTPTLLEQELE
jgi:hypothetical protein